MQEFIISENPKEFLTLLSLLHHAELQELCDLHKQEVDNITEKYKTYGQTFIDNQLQIQEVQKKIKGITNALNGAKVSNLRVVWIHDKLLIKGIYCYKDGYSFDQTWELDGNTWFPNVKERRLFKCT